MKRKLSKKSILITSITLLLLLAVGATLAYVFTQTEGVTNTFNPAEVACAVVENNGTPTTGSTVDTGSVKENVQIQNTGDTEAYIRVAVVINWMNEDGTKVWAAKPVLSTDGTPGDYTIEYDLANGWFDGGDGFYYYSLPVAPTELTSVLIQEATLIGTAPTGTDDTQYYLSIEIVASSIQSTPSNVVCEQWGVTVADDGTISKTSE